jgi:hypothetical protein
LRKYKTNLQRITQKYKNEVKLIKYWDKIEKIFISHKKNKDKSFTYTFKHKDEYDDEFKIEAIAAEHGYKIVDEDLRHNKSTYTFIMDYDNPNSKGRIF